MFTAQSVQRQRGGSGTSLHLSLLEDGTPKGTGSRQGALPGHVLGDSKGRSLLSASATAPLRSALPS